MLIDPINWFPETAEAKTLRMAGTLRSQPMTIHIKGLNHRQIGTWISCTGPSRDKYVDSDMPLIRDRHLLPDPDNLNRGYHALWLSRSNGFDRLTRNDEKWSELMEFVNGLEK